MKELLHRAAVLVTAAALVVAPAGPADAAATPEAAVEAEAGCLDVEYQATTWSTGPDTGGFVATVTLVNGCDTQISGWTLVLNLAAGHAFTSGWSANWTVSGDRVTATNLPWNGELAPGGSTTIGFVGSFAGTYQDPVSCTINGAACAGAGNEPPEVALTSPADGAGFPGVCPVRLAADAVDPDGQIDRVEFYVNDVLVGTADEAPYRVDVASSDPVLNHLGEAGTNTAFARAFDDGSPAASTDSAVVTFYLLPIPPALMVVACTPVVEVEEGGSATATFVTACENPTRVDLSVAGDPGITVAPASYVPSFDGFGDDVTVSAAPGTAGATATITATAEDDVGCLNATVAVTVVAGPDQNLPPVVTVTSPAEGDGTVYPCAARLAADATDPDGEIDRVEFHLNGVPVGTVHAAPYRLDVDPSHSAVDGFGSNVVMARAFDNGNPAASTDSEPVTFRYVVPPPAVAIIACTPVLELAAGGADVVNFRGFGATGQVELTVAGDPGITVSPTAFFLDSAGQDVTVTAAPGSAGAAATITASGAGALPATVSVTVAGGEG